MRGPNLYSLLTFIEVYVLSGYDLQFPSNYMAKNNNFSLKFSKQAIFFFYSRVISTRSFDSNIRHKFF